MKISNSKKFSGFSASVPMNSIFSRGSDLTTTNVCQGCGYVKFRVWLCAKRCGYV